MGELRMADFRFEVAISFAGDNKRDVIRHVAKALKGELGEGKVFFDEWFEAELAGPDAHIVLQKVYRRASRLVVACVCNRYGDKPWTQEEWRAIQAFERELRDAGSANSKRLRFLPLRFDDADVDGLFETAIVPDVRSRSPRQIADLILERLRLCRNGDSSDDAVRLSAQPGTAAAQIADPSSSMTHNLRTRTQRETRYILYVARERVGNLYLQVSPDIFEASTLEQAQLLQYREPNARAVDEAARARAVRQLFTVLEHLESTARMGDLNELVATGGRLEADWYHVRCSFTAGAWDPADPTVHLTGTIGPYTLILVCSKSDLTGVNKEGASYVPTSVSHVLLSGGGSLPLSGLIRIVTVDVATKTIRGSALYLVVESLTEGITL